MVRELARAEPRIRIESLPRNMGPAAARNRGFAVARAPWIAVLDSDDLFAPDRLRQLIRVAERVGADIVSDNLLYFADLDSMSRDVHLANAKAGWLSTSDYLRESRLFGRGQDYGYLKPLFRGEALRAVNLRYDERLRIAEDDDLIVRALIAGLRYWLEPQETYFYRKHAASTSHRLSVANARSMCVASSELIAINVGTAQLPQLKRRHRALERGLAFAQLVDALKEKRALDAMSIALKNPGAVPLLKLPLGAAVRRLVAPSALLSQ
jgi:succinoglycan biosynthesis protein ExoO